METITNKIAQNEPANPIPLDFAGSDDAVTIDNGIRETIRGISLSLLAMSLGLAKIKPDGLFRDLGCLSIGQYITRLCNDTKTDRSNLFKWLAIGEAYIKYQKDLEKTGFSENDGLNKLRYLEKALVNNRRQEVFDNIKTMTFREFTVFAKAGREDPAIPVPVVEIRGSTVYIDGKLAIIISKKLDRRLSAYFRKVIRIACEAYEEQGAICPVRLRSLREAIRFEHAAERLKQQMGIG